MGAQGIEAGGHQGSFDDDTAPDTGWGLLALVTAVRQAVDIPVIAAGGLMTGADVAAVIRAGAVAAQMGTAFLRCPESGASATPQGGPVRSRVHRARPSPGPSAVGGPGAW